VTWEVSHFRRNSRLEASTDHEERGPWTRESMHVIDRWPIGRVWFELSIAKKGSFFARSTSRQ
jgi:hypothetical protein